MPKGRREDKPQKGGLDKAGAELPSSRGAGVRKDREGAELPFVREKLLGS